MEELFIKRFAEALEIEASELALDSYFKELEEWDSMSRLSVVVMLDEQYNIQIEEQRFNEIQTVEELYLEVVSRTNG